MLAAGLLLALCLLVLGAAPAQAQQCHSGSAPFAFGTVSTSANTNAAATISFECQSTWNSSYAFALCVMIPASPTVDPRRMTNYNNGYLYYNFYHDAARTQIIGPPTDGGGYAIQSHTVVVPANNYNFPGSITVYGRVPPVPGGTPAGVYQAEVGGVYLRYAYSPGTTPPSSCLQSPGGSVNYIHMSVSAQVPSGCTIGILQPNDLDFGDTGSLATAINGQTSISLNCPANTTWRLGLNNGNHALSGQRRMAGPAGNFVGYELYRDAGRTQRWGNDLAGGSDVASGSGPSQSNPLVLPVYGQVPAQAPVAAGTYSDTITITLEY